MWLLIAFFFEHNVLKASIGWQLQRLTDSKETKPKCCSRNTVFGEAGQRLRQNFTLLRQRRSGWYLCSSSCFFFFCFVFFFFCLVLIFAIQIQRLIKRGKNIIILDAKSRIAVKLNKKWDYFSFFR